MMEDNSDIENNDQYINNQYINNQDIEINDDNEETSCSICIEHVEDKSATWCQNGHAFHGNPCL